MKQKIRESISDNKPSEKEELRYAQLKIRKAVLFCIPALIVSYMLLIAGICLLAYYVKNIFVFCIFCFLLIIGTSLVGRTLLELLKK